jgi:hypothetical protein
MPFKPFLPGGDLPPPPMSPAPPSASVPPSTQPYQSKPKYVEKSRDSRPPNPYKVQHQPNNQYQRPKEDKKNNLWIKNLPRQYNTVEALSGFFKKYGQIRDVYPSLDKNMACINFYK